MGYQLESALVLTLRESLKWESSIDASESGTLTQVGAVDSYDMHKYQSRDRELAFRDMITAGAVLEANVQFSDVYNYPALGLDLVSGNMIGLKLQGAIHRDLPFQSSEMGTGNANHSQVRHVGSTSIPYDAIRYADADLYGRDCLLYDILARACQEAFTDPPIQRIDPYSTVFSDSGSFAWSLAEGDPNRTDISSAAAMNVNLFKRPDQNLADRDNFLAAHVSRVAKALANPFESALRLYVEVTGPESREMETYVLTQSDENTRTWTAEPALSDRECIVYYVKDRLVQWKREDTDEVHVKQVVAMQIAGIVPGQSVSVIPEIPEGKDCQYWRQKAAQIKPQGEMLTDTDLSVRQLSSGQASGGYASVNSKVLTVGGAGLTVNFDTDFSTGNHKVSVLVKPVNRFSLNGLSNSAGRGGLLDTFGASFDGTILPNATDIIQGVEYAVTEGAGVVYADGTYAAGAVFKGTTTADYYELFDELDPSFVRQYSMPYSIALPAGMWRMQVEYTDANEIGGKFGLSATAEPINNRTEVILSETSMFTAYDNGTYSLTNQGYVTSQDGVPFDIVLRWTSSDGTVVPYISHLLFEADSTEVVSGSYHLLAQFGGTVHSAFIQADAGRAETVCFDGTVGSTGTDGSVVLSWVDPSDQTEFEATRTPLSVSAISVQEVGTFTPTPAAEEFIGWREQCLQRAEYTVKQNYMNVVRLYGTEVPSHRASGSEWSAEAHENWMALVESGSPRLREIPAVPRDNLAYGRQYEVTDGSVIYDGSVITEGFRFYAGSSGTVCTGSGSISQVGAFIKSLPGHVGEPALMPNGIYLNEDGEVMSYYDTAQAYPVLVSCQPWMIELGAYVAQQEFRVPRFL